MATFKFYSYEVFVDTEVELVPQCTCWMSLGKLTATCSFNTPRWGRGGAACCQRGNGS